MPKNKSSFLLLFYSVISLKEKYLQTMKLLFEVLFSLIILVQALGSNDFIKCSQEAFILCQLRASIRKQKILEKKNKNRNIDVLQKRGNKYATKYRFKTPKFCRTVVIYRYF